MKIIYLTGSVNPVIEYFKLIPQGVTVLSDTLPELSRSLQTQHAMSIKCKDIKASELVVCAISANYVMNAEDVFTLAYAAGLGKQLAFLGHITDTTHHLSFFKASPYLVFEDISELLEYIRLDER